MTMEKRLQKMRGNYGNTWEQVAERVDEFTVHLSRIETGKVDELASNF